MITVNPIIVTPALLTGSNVPENDAPEWSAAANYQIGDKVIYNHRVYESLVNPNTGLQPDVSPTQWLDLGATNKFRMFDEVVDQQTINPGSVSVTLNVGQVVNSLSAQNLDADNITVSVISPTEGLVYQRSIPLQDNTAVVDWYSYYFETIVRKRDITLIDLPNYVNASIGVTISASSGNAAIGELIVGRQKMQGITLMGTSVSIRDYSRKEVDQFGNFIIVPRRFAKLADYDIVVPTAQVAAVQQSLAALRATPVLYIGDSSKPETVVYGFYRSFSIVLDGPQFSSCSLEVEGLV